MARLLTREQRTSSAAYDYPINIPTEAGSGLVSMAIQIGVIDTGIDQGNQYLKGKILQGVWVCQENGTYVYKNDFHDYHGHGTFVAARIQTFSPETQVCAVRIAQQDENNVVVRVQEQALAMGIEWCIEQEIKIVNVSYSIAEAPNGGFLATTCQKAYESGTIIVAAYRNGEEVPVYPAAFPTVIGVRRRDDLEPGQVSVLDEENFDLFAYGGSNSIATAQVSAMVGRIHSVDDSLDLETVFAYLKAVAIP